MYTSFVMLALAGFIAAPTPASYAPDPVWWRDYGLAQQEGSKERKPLAVFVGSGPGGYEKLTQEGTLTSAINKSLAEHYICVYLDADTKTAKSMMLALEIPSKGLVISDRSGAFQAFHHSGEISQADLAKHLAQFSSTTISLRTTVTSGISNVSYYPPSGGYTGGASYPSSNFNNMIHSQSFAPSGGSRNC